MPEISNILNHRYDRRGPNMKEKDARAGTFVVVSRTSCILHDILLLFHKRRRDYSELYYV